ncbi:MAG: hypothetical protein JSW39_03175 [Desulfobacterales bacterium]|nr:MAG: hypothetical protein JSW39_03175 [Desulfobacterales bacterium]
MQRAVIAGCIGLIMCAWTASQFAFGATVSGQVVLPASDGGWQPGIYGTKVRVEGTDIQTDVVVTGYAEGEFTLNDVPAGRNTMLFIEKDQDAFTQASKRVEVDVTGDILSDVAFELGHHWQELTGYPTVWGAGGYGEWNAHFVSDRVGFLLFRVRGSDIDPERREIYRTLDGGATWKKIGHWEYDADDFKAGQPYPGYWRSFHFSDQNHGVILAAIHCWTVGLSMRMMAASDCPLAVSY